MKKIIAVVLCVAIILTLSASVFAAETDNRETVVKLTVDPDMESYVLSIPAEAVIDPTSKAGTMTVSLSDVELVWNQMIKVYVSSANKLYLVNEENDSQKIGYRLKSLANNNYEDPGYAYALEVGSASNTSSDKEIELEMTVKDVYPGAGVYTDILTFSVELQ